MDRLLLLLFPAHEPRAAWNRLASALFLVALVFFSARYFAIAIDDLGWAPGPMHHVHLVFHEAGHAIFMMVGAPRPLVVFMGSGLQVLFPLILAGAFYFKNRDAFGAAVALGGRVTMAAAFVWGFATLAYETWFFPEEERG